MTSHKKVTEKPTNVVGLGFESSKTGDKRQKSEKRPRTFIVLFFTYFGFRVRSIWNLTWTDLAGDIENRVRGPQVKKGPFAL